MDKPKPPSHQKVIKAQTDNFLEKLSKHDFTKSGYEKIESLLEELQRAPSLTDLMALYCESKKHSVDVSSTIKMNIIPLFKELLLADSSYRMSTEIYELLFELSQEELLKLDSDNIVSKIDESIHFA
jgi:hypothetical protein